MLFVALRNTGTLDHHPCCCQSCRHCCCYYTPVRKWLADLRQHKNGKRKADGANYTRHQASRAHPRLRCVLKGIMLFPFLKMKDKLNRKARRRRQILALKRIKWRRATQHSLKKQSPGSGFRPCLQGTSDPHRNLEVSY